MTILLIINVTILSIFKDILSILVIVIPAIWAVSSWVRSKRGGISWRAIEKAVEKLYQKMDAANYRPDNIVCLGRAGSIAGTLLSHRFGKKVIPIVVLTFEYTVSDVHPQHKGKEHLRSEIISECCTVQEGLGNVLLLGIDIMTGSTMQVGLEELDKLKVAHSATACLFWHPDAKLKPTFYAEKRTTRLRYPWMSTSFWQNWGISR